MIDFLAKISDRLDPRLARLRGRFAPQWGWFLRRLSPTADLGLHFTLSAVALIGTCWLFGGITEDVLHGDPITVVDAQLANYFNSHAEPWLTRTMVAISITGSGPFLTVMACAVGIVLIRRRCWYRLLTLALVVPGGALLNVFLKNLIHRPRPIFENPIVVLHTFSFPSGHTMAATLFYGLMAVFAWIAMRGWRGRTMAVMGAFFIIGLIAFSRVYLGVHYLSDVLGAMAVGIAWLAFCLTTVDLLRRRSKNRRGA